MKLKLDRIFYFLLITQIISTQGILTFNIFKFLGNWELKSYMHLGSVMLTLLLIVFYRINKGTIKLSLEDILLITYSIVCFIVLLFNTSDLESNVIAFREV